MEKLEIYLGTFEDYKSRKLDFNRIWKLKQEKTSEEGLSSGVTEYFIFSQFAKHKSGEIISSVAKLFIEKCCVRIQYTSEELYRVY